MEKPQAQQGSKATKVQLGSVVVGQMKELKRKAGATDDPPAELAAMEPNTRFLWAGWTWQVGPRSTEYKIEVVKSDREGFRARTTARPGTMHTGSADRLQTLFKSLKPMPAEVNDLSIGETFEWYDTTWALASKMIIHDIKVVE